MAQMVKNLPAMQETQVRGLDWEDPLEKGLATSIPEYWNTRIQYSSILAWRIPRTEGPGDYSYSAWNCKESDTTERLTLTTDPFFYFRDHVGLFSLKKKKKTLPNHGHKHFLLCFPLKF